MDATRIIRNSIYGSSADFAIEHWQEAEKRRRDEFARSGDITSHKILESYIKSDNGIDRLLKLKDISFGLPIMGLIESRPSIYSVLSVHYIAGYKITIKRHEDTSENTIWYETPIDCYYCRISELEEIIHEHILEAIQRDSKWETLK